MRQLRQLPHVGNYEGLVEVEIGRSGVERFEVGMYGDMAIGAFKMGDVTSAPYGMLSMLRDQV